MGNDYGLMCVNGSDPVMLYNETNYPDGGYNTFHSNDYQVYADDNSYPLLGKAGNYPGNNSFLGNCDYLIYQESAASDTIWAQNNYWGGGQPDTTKLHGEIAYRPYLTSEPDGFVGNEYPAYSNKNSQSGICGDPGGGSNPEALYLNEIGTELYLDQQYPVAIDTFNVVLSNYPNDPSAQYALNFIDNSFRRMEDYSNAVSYLSNCAIQAAGTALPPQAQYRAIYHLKQAGFAEDAYALATDESLLKNLSQSQQEHAVIESGFLQKYYLGNPSSGDSIFKEFLEKYPSSALTLIAATELGMDPPPSNTTFGTQGAGIAVNPALPKAFALHQNFPNPFNPATTIRYELPETADVSLTVYNIAGRQVATLVEGKESAGYKTVVWEGKNRWGGDLTSGVYILQLAADGASGRAFFKTKKMLLLK
jgi:hypothetical protein